MKDKYSIYVHIPFCKARCSYCAFVSDTDYSVQLRYFAKLFEEIEYYSDKTKPIYTVYIGGGTPSSVDFIYIDALFQKLRDCFDLSQTEEITVECNPESTSDEMLSCLKRNGVTRLSFGLQSVNDKTLRFIGRLHNYAQFVDALGRARAKGFANVNADLIIGLPETHADFIRSVQTAVQLPLEHISLYALELHERTPLYQRLNGVSPFSDDEQADMYDEAVELLASHGFARYEISNFAKSGFESKHNLHYWQEGYYYGFGVAAAGFLPGVRTVNELVLRSYLDTAVEYLNDYLSEYIDTREVANEFVMLGLRLEKGISVSEFAERFGVDFWKFFSTANGLRERGFLIADGDRVRIPADKFYVANSILAELWHSDRK